MTDKVLTDQEVDLLLEYIDTLPASPPDGRWDTFCCMARRLTDVFSREFGVPAEAWASSFGVMDEREFFLSLPRDLSCTTAELAHVPGRAAVTVCRTLREHLAGLQEGPEADAAGAWVAGLFLEAAREGWACVHPCAFGREVGQEVAWELAARREMRAVAVVCFIVSLSGGRLGSIKLVVPCEALEGLREAGLRGRSAQPLSTRRSGGCR